MLRLRACVLIMSLEQRLADLEKRVETLSDNIASAMGVCLVGIDEIASLVGSLRDEYEDDVEASALPAYSELIPAGLFE